MKAFLFFAAVLIVINGGGIQARSQQGHTRSDSDLIMTAEQAWADAAVQKDVLSFAKYLSDDYVLIVVRARTASKSEFELTSKSKWVEMLRSGREKYDAVEIHNLNIRINGNVATVTGEYSQKGRRDHKDISDSGLYVDTWVKRKDQWLLISSVFP